MIFDRFTEPWEHCIVEDFFPEKILKLLQNMPQLSVDYKIINGFRDVLKNRFFLNNDFFDKNPVFTDILQTLNQKNLFEEKLNCSLSNCLLRIELIDDCFPFYHESHLDSQEKLLTIIIYIDKDDVLDLGTDLFLDKDRYAKKIQWKNNSALFFAPSNEKWHGFNPMQYTGIRRLMIVNFVKTDEWRDIQQCYTEN
jgi:hypothetical protein